MLLYRQSHPKTIAHLVSFVFLKDIFKYFQPAVWHLLAKPRSFSACLSLTHSNLFRPKKSFKLSTEQNMQKQTLNFRDSDAFRLSWRCPLNSPQRWSVLSLGVPLVLCLRSAGHAVADSRLFLSWAQLEIGSLERNCLGKKDTKNCWKTKRNMQQVITSLYRLITVTPPSKGWGSLDYRPAVHMMLTWPLQHWAVPRPPVIAHKGMNGSARFAWGHK